MDCHSKSRIPQPLAIEIEAEAEPPAPYLEAEVKVLRRHDPLLQEVSEAPLQDVRPQTIVHFSKDQCASGTCFPFRSRTMPSVLQSPVFRIGRLWR